MQVKYLTLAKACDDDVVLSIKIVIGLTVRVITIKEVRDVPNEDKRISKEISKVFISTITDLGLDVFLELKGDGMWCSTQEMKEAYQYTVDIVSEARDQLSMLTLEDANKNTYIEHNEENSNSDDKDELSKEEIESIALLCLYSSASMSP